MQDLAERVLALLYDRPEAGYSLNELAGRTHAKIVRLRRAMDELMAAGQPVEWSPAYGFRLGRPVRLNAHLIERNLGTRRVGRHVIVFPEVQSTNDVVFQAARQSGGDGLVVLAEAQTAGRGRHGRQWISPSGSNILLSVLLLQGQSPLPHEAMTIAGGLAAAEAIEDACRLQATLKWPNDVLLEGRKVAGALVEARRQGGHASIVLGVGINANAAPCDQKVDSPATSLAAHVGIVERTEVVRALLRRLDQWIHAIAAGELASLHDAWMSRCGMLNERCTIRSEGRDYTGRVVDVSVTEGLVLCCDDGRCVRIPAAEATVVPRGGGSAR